MGESGVRLTHTLQQSYAEFLQGHAKLAARGPVDGRHQFIQRALAE